MREVNPKDTSLAQAFELWMKAPNPMITSYKVLAEGDAQSGTPSARSIHIKQTILDRILTF